MLVVNPTFYYLAKMLEATYLTWMITYDVIPMCIYTHICTKICTYINAFIYTYTYMNICV